MAYVYYTLAGITLYLISDWLLEYLESTYGSRFQYRSLIFLVIISVLGVTASQIVAFFNP